MTVSDPTRPPTLFDRAARLVGRVFGRPGTGRTATGILGASASVQTEARRLADVLVASERRSAAVERSVTEAELRVLRAQVNPHFMFNALSTFGRSAHASPDAADAMLRQLLNLLRDVLAKTNAQLVPLADELAAIEAHAAFENANQPTVMLDVDAGAHAKEARVPPLLMLPFVAETAAAARAAAAPRRLRIGATREHATGDAPGFLRIVVSIERTTPAADGATVQAATVAGVQRRLQQHFGIAATATAASADSTDKVEILVPWITGDPVIAGSL